MRVRAAGAADLDVEGDDDLLVRGPFVVALQPAHARELPTGHAIDASALLREEGVEVMAICGRAHASRAEAEAAPTHVEPTSENAGCLALPRAGHVRSAIQDRRGTQP